MITVGFSTRNDNSKFIEYLKESSGLKEIEVIQKINNGEKSLSVVYNEIISESKNDIVVLCHDDLYFDTKSWGKKVSKLFENNDYGIIGLAGTTYLPSSGMWWEHRECMVGIVNHQHEGKKWESKYSSHSNKIQKTVIVDGLFICINKKKIKNTFNEEVQGFHFYDLFFCFENFLNGVEIGVTNDIRVTHLSIGKTNEQWEKNKELFVDKYKNRLPSKIDKIDSDLTTYIICHDVNIIKSNIESKKYDTLGNVVFLYVGSKSPEDLTEYKNVIIVKNLKFNIEEYPAFTAFTAWYAIWRNRLCKTKYINLLEYDTNLSENFDFFLKNLSKNITSL